MISDQVMPYELLTAIGNFYEVTIVDGVVDGEVKTITISGELRGWFYDEDRGLGYAIIWENGASRAEDYFVGDILAVKEIKGPNENVFFEPYKGRNVEWGMVVDVYRNLHTNNGYSIRSAKTGLVLAHCSNVHLTNARFHVSESGRQKTVQEKRKRVHAYVRGQLAACNVQLPATFTKVHYNPYYTALFTDSLTNKPIYEAEEVICSGKFAYVKNPIAELKGSK